MKKIFIFLTAALFAASGSAAFAQTENITEEQTVSKEKGQAKERVVVEEGDDEKGHYVKETTYTDRVLPGKFNHNWELGIGIGAQFYIGDNDWKAKFSEWWTGPAVDLTVTKWVTPNVGVAFGMNYSPFRGAYQYNSTAGRAAYKTDEKVTNVIDPKYNNLCRQSSHTFNPFVTAMLDMDNICCGYNPDRIYNVGLYLGGGVIFGLNDPLKVGATFNAGIMNMFRITKNLDFIINIRGGLVSDSFDGESANAEPSYEYEKINIPVDGIFGITGGLAYRFGYKNGKEWETEAVSKKTYVTTVEGERQINSLKSALAAVQAENAALVNMNHQLSERANYERDSINVWYHVQFKIDKWEVRRRELVNLKAIADLMKAAPDVKFSLCGFADKQTATPEHNEMLSRNRVNEVYKVLTEQFGVNPDQIEKDYKGGVDLMFYNDNVLSRCVIIKTVDGKGFRLK